MSRFLVAPIVVVACLVCLSMAPTVQSEVPSFFVTPGHAEYGGYQFRVLTEKQELMHKQWEAYYVAVAVTRTGGAIAKREGWLEIWDDRQFICATAVPATPAAMIPIKLREQVGAEDTMVFLFTINPLFTKQTWFDYQVIGKDGNVERNCDIYLRDFMTLPERSGQG